MNPVGLVARKGYPQESVIKTIFFGSSPRHVNLDYDVSGKHGRYTEGGEVSCIRTEQKGLLFVR